MGVCTQWLESWLSVPKTRQGGERLTAEEILEALPKEARDTFADLAGLDRGQAERIIQLLGLGSRTVLLSLGLVQEVGEGENRYLTLTDRAFPVMLAAAMSLGGSTPTVHPDRILLQADAAVARIEERAAADTRSPHSHDVEGLDSETAEDQVPQFAKGHAAPPGKAPAAEPTVGSISSPWISRPTMRNPRRSRALGARRRIPHLAEKRQGQPAYGQSPPRLSGENCTIVLTDVVGFGARSRNDEDRRVIRQALFQIMQTALPTPPVWSEDRGDGLLSVVPPTVPTANVIERLVGELPAALELHNNAFRKSTRFQLRVAVNVGPVFSDFRGMTGEAIVVVDRLVDAPALKEAIPASAASLGIITSPFVYENIIKHTDDQAGPRAYVSSPSRRQGIQRPRVDAGHQLASR